MAINSSGLLGPLKVEIPADSLNGLCHNLRLLAMPSVISRRWKKILVLFLAFSPALFTAQRVWDQAVDVGNWDDWETATFLDKWRDGTLAWSDLYAAQIQHRMVFPRLLVIALAELSAGDFRANIYAIQVLFCVASFLLLVMLRRTLPGSPWRWPLWFSMNLLLFSPMHFETQLWGAQLWSTTVMPCALTAIMILATRPSTLAQSWQRLGLALLLTEVATHSFAHGLALWPTCLVMLWANPAFGSWRTRLAQSAVLLTTAGLSLWAYFTNFINVAFHAYNLKPGDHAMKGASSLFEGDHVQKAVEFFTGFIGAWFARSPFLGHPLEFAQTLGIATLLLGGVLVATCLLWKECRNRYHQALPWLGLTAYVVTVGLMLSKRAADTGVHRAVMIRYLAINEYALIALLGLSAVVGPLWLTAVWRWAQYWRKNSPLTDLPNGTQAIVGATLLTAFCALQLPLWQYGLHLSEVWHRGRRHGQALMLLLPHLQEQKKLISMRPLCKSYDYCLEAMHTLQRIGLQHTAPLLTPELKWFTQDKKPLVGDKATVTSSQLDGAGIWQIGGHARFGAETPVDLVLFVQHGRIIGIGQPTPKPALRLFGLDFDVANIEEFPVSALHIWRAQLDTKLVPEPSGPVELWALDVRNRRVVRFAETIRPPQP
ncbi:MAG: hypothetical protein ACOYMN_02065 [Roseimicrobium sp.]